MSTVYVLLSLTNELIQSSLHTYKVYAVIVHGDFSISSLLSALRTFQFVQVMVSNASSIGGKKRRNSYFETCGGRRAIKVDLNSPSRTVCATRRVLYTLGGLGYIQFARRLERFKKITLISPYFARCITMATESIAPRNSIWHFTFFCG